MVVGTSCTTTKCKKKVSLSYPYPTVFVLKWFLILSNSYLTGTGSLAGCFADYQVVTKIASKAMGRPILRRKHENQVHFQCMHFFSDSANEKKEKYFDLVEDGIVGKLVKTIIGL